MNAAAVLCACLYVTMILGPAQPAQAAPTRAESPVARWYQSLPGWGCYDTVPFPPAYQVKARIGPDADSYIGTRRFKMYPEFSTVWRVGALYDAPHRQALFYDSDGNEMRQFLLVANATPPPIAVDAKDLAALAMGGRVHLGDTLEQARAAFNLPAPLHLKTMQRCKFHGAAAYSAAIFYGPPNVPPVPKSRNTCALIGPDIKIGQTLGIIMFRDNRVAVLIWEKCGA